MKSARYLLCMFLVIATLPSLLIAQQRTTTSSTVVPQLVNYSGKATDGQGKPISGITGITFSIYKEQDGGAALWMETQNVTADTKGNYIVQLGASRSEGLPLDLFASGEARWLGVRINGGEEQPRVLLLSVPYALKAADAQTLGGLPASAFLKTSDSKSVNAASTAPPPAGTITGSGSVNRVAKFVGTNQIGNSHIFDGGNGVGIGTTSPTAVLDVKGTGRIRGTATVDGNVAAGGNVSAAGNLSANGNVTASNMTATSSGGPAMWGENFGSGGGSDGVHGVAHGAGSGVAGVNDNASGAGVWAQGVGWGLYGTSSGSQAIWGESFGSGLTNGSGPDGVHGVAHSANGSGGGFINWADGGVGVWGEAPTGFGFYTPNNVQQARTANGWVKAMIQWDGESSGTMLRCFNSTLSGAAATTVPCGFSLQSTGQGLNIDFGFEVDDRFFSATMERCACGSKVPLLFTTPQSTTVLSVDVLESGTSNAIPSQWYLIVF